MHQPLGPLGYAIQFRSGRIYLDGQPVTAIVDHDDRTITLPEGISQAQTASLMAAAAREICDRRLRPVPLIGGVD